MAKTITIFNNMKPDVPQWTDANHVYSLSNVDPLYYLAEGVQEKQRAPLVASRAFTQLSLGTLSTIKYMIPSKANTSFDVFTSHDDGSVNGIRINANPDGTIVSSTKTNMGLVFGGPGTGYNNKIIVFADKLIGVRGAGAGDIAYTTITSGGSSGSWTSYPYNSTTNPIFFVGTPEMEVFLDKVWISDSYQRNTMSAIRGFSNSGSAIIQDTSLVFNIPDGFSIQRMKNYQNNYLAVAAVYNSLKNTVVPGDLAQNSSNFLFFFNGKTKGFQYSIELPGAFIDMAVVNNVLKVLLQERFGQYAIYRVSGSTIIFEKYIQLDTPKTLPLFTWQNMLGINLNTKGMYITGKMLGEDVSYIASTTSYNGVVSDTMNSRLYAFTDGTVSVQQVIGNSYNDLTMVSQWVPVDTPLVSIDVVYETPPQVVGDYIRVTLDSWGEDQQDGILTQQLNDITSTTKDTRIKTTLDAKGLTPSMCRVTIQTHSTGSWRPIIREIQINESKQ